MTRTILSFGPIKVYWYGVMYLLGFIAAWVLAKIKAKKLHPTWTTEQISDLIFYAAMGVILGGRIGYIIFYSFSKFLADPLFIFKTWEGGMSFHGGVIGVLLAMILFARKMRLPFFTISDFIVPLVPLGIFFGRIGNFINGELPGRITNVPWGMVFPYAGDLPRHPSQLYEASLEGLILFVILWLYSSKPHPRSRASALFLIGYGAFRFTCEFFREPDIQIGFVAFNWLTMGQLLSIPLVVIGTLIWFWAGENN